MDHPRAKPITVKTLLRAGGGRAGRHAAAAAARVQVPTCQQAARGPGWVGGAVDPRTRHKKKPPLCGPGAGQRSRVHCPTRSARLQARARRGWVAPDRGSRAAARRVRVSLSAFVRGALRARLRAVVAAVSKAPPPARCAPAIRGPRALPARAGLIPGVRACGPRGRGRRPARARPARRPGVFTPGAPKKKRGGTSRQAGASSSLGRRCRSAPLRPPAGRRDGPDPPLTRPIIRLTIAVRT
jgi:hypothetical protein